MKEIPHHSCRMSDAPFGSAPLLPKSQTPRYQGGMESGRRKVGCRGRPVHVLRSPGHLQLEILALGALLCGSNLPGIPDGESGA
jgi:hypothetical protein